MKLRNTAIALGVGAATFAGLSLLKVDKPVVINSTAAVLIGGLVLSARRGGKSRTDKGPLRGKELIEKVQELGDIAKADLVEACGYFGTNSKGEKRLNFTAFYEALLEAKAVVYQGEKVRAPGDAYIEKSGSQLSYVATVQSNGNLLIGKAYTALLDLKIGDQFDIKLGPNLIRLIPAETGLGDSDNSGTNLSYIATIQGNGNLLIDKAYTALLDLKAGDDLEIKLDQKQIILILTETGEEGIDEDEVEVIPLTGRKLINKIKELGDTPTLEIIKACGYSETDATPFNEALLEAKGVSLDTLALEDLERTISEGKDTASDLPFSKDAFWVSLEIVTNIYRENTAMSLATYKSLGNLEDYFNPEIYDRDSDNEEEYWSQIIELKDDFVVVKKCKEEIKWLLDQEEGDDLISLHWAIANDGSSEYKDKEDFLAAFDEDQVVKIVKNAWDYCRIEKVKKTIIERLEVLNSDD